MSVPRISGPRDYHPRWFRPYVSTYWWLQRRSYFAFIMRELSSIFVAWGVVYMLLLIRAVSRGAAQYAEFLTWSGKPSVLVINVVTFGFIVYHAITWFTLSPQAMVVRFRRRRIPGSGIIASQYVAWLVLSAFVIWLVLRG
ncbi:MAG: fumarate reductase subunit C [Gemmatimonadaceae bacterium]